MLLEHCLEIWRIIIVLSGMKLCFHKPHILQVDYAIAIIENENYFEMKITERIAALYRFARHTVTNSIFMIISMSSENNSENFLYKPSYQNFIQKILILTRRYSLCSCTKEPFSNSTGKILYLCMISGGLFVRVLFLDSFYAEKMVLSNK